MELSSLVFLIEFGLVFGAVFVFGYFQLRSLDKLDKEEAEREAKEHEEQLNKTKY